MAYYFQLPQIVELTEDQQMALEDVNPITISGGAGTGKTVVSLWRHRQNIETFNKFSVLMTFTKTLGEYLSMSLSNIEHKNVFFLKNFPLNNNWKADEIIIDEAQDLDFETIQAIKNHGKEVSYGADFNQQLYSNKVTINDMESLFPNNELYDLQQNFRNTYYILNFTKVVLYNFFINQRTLDELKYDNIGVKPIISITNSFEKEIEKLIEIINEFKSETHNIAILLPFQDGRTKQGTIWDYSYAQCVDKYYEALANRGISCSRYYNNMQIDNIEIDNIHITTFKSAKGLEFDTVIIPQLDKFQSNIQNVRVINEEDYYVAFTRAKTNLFLISLDELSFIDENTVDIEYLDKNNH